MGRRYLVIGTGAIGGFYGGKLAHAGEDVHFLLHSDYEYVKEYGLRIDSADGDIYLPHPNIYFSAEDMPVGDVVLIALKTTHNYYLPRLLPPIVGPHTVVIVLQNGLGNESEITQIVPPSQLMGGLAFICANKIGRGHIQHLDYGQLTLAEHSVLRLTQRSKEIGLDFTRAGITVTLVKDLVLARWKKLMWNVPFNGLSVLLNAETDEMITNSLSLSLARELMEEVLVAARRIDGREISAEFIDEMIDNTAKMKPYSPSMKLDFEGNRPMELEAIYGNILRAAQQVNLELPRIKTIYQLLTYLENRTIPQRNRLNDVEDIHS